MASLSATLLSMVDRCAESGELPTVKWFRSWAG